MKKMTNQVKIIICTVIFVLFTLGTYFYGFDIMAKRNSALADAIAQRNVELEVLLREQKSFEQGKKDLAILEKSDYPPEDLFSSDTKVVKEIQQLESAAQRFGLKLNISVSGTAQNAIKIEKTASSLFAIPYIITLEGSMDNIMMFVQAAEHMPFVSHVKSLSIEAGEEGLSNATITSEFYIKK